MEFVDKKFREIDLVDITSFFGLDFFNFLAYCETSTPKNVELVHYLFKKNTGNVFWEFFEVLFHFVK